jgi:hypothetical protein
VEKEPVPPPPANPSVTEQPIYWFCLLEQAIAQGDFAQAAQAKEALKGLGIEITYRPWARTKRSRGEGSHAK